MTIFDDIKTRAALKIAQQKAEYEALMTRVFRQDEKLTSQFSSTHHQTRVDDTGEKIMDSLRTRPTERGALLQAGGVIAGEPNAPLLDTPNRFETRAARRRCSHCKVWKLGHEFSTRQRGNGAVYLQSWCKTCCADYARQQYHGLNQRAP